MSRCRSAILLVGLLMISFGFIGPVVAQTTTKPNILIIWGDDIGQFNISAYNRGMMGYRTPNIDRIANEGAMFTDWYAQQSHPHGGIMSLAGR